MATMVTTEAHANSAAPFRTMSISQFIPRFTSPRILTSNIPTYRHSFSLPDEETKKAKSGYHAVPQLEKSRAKFEEGSEEEPTQPSSASYIEWNKLLPVPSTLLGSFQDLFEARKNAASIVTEGLKTDQHDSADVLATPSASPPPRLVFFGEQHHQPQVMRAQLQTLFALHRQCSFASDPAKQKESDAKPIYRLHLILEHFSVLDQRMLHSFSSGALTPDELADQYKTQSEESFQIGHYMPLLMLAKELQVPIWGGFPPRDWARQVFRNGIESIKDQEEQRTSVSDDEKQSSAQVSTLGRSLQSPPFTSWSAVTKIGAAHRSYLSGLFRPDLPPRFPQLPSDSVSSNDSSMPDSQMKAPLPSIYPTWLLKSHNIETKGFGPAQALKDSYLAHVTAWILRGALPEVSTTERREEQQCSSLNAAASHKEAFPPPIQPSGTSDNSGRPIVNVALVVCGLGHAEYGFGAPERVVQLLSQQGAAPNDGSSALLPYIIASKPLDSGIWLGYEHQSQEEASDEIEPQKARPAGESTQAEMLPTAAHSAHTVDRWLNDPWGRKMADAVLLYDWIDDGPKDDAKTSEDGH